MSGLCVTMHWVRIVSSPVMTFTTIFQTKVVWFQKIAIPTLRKVIGNARGGGMSQRSKIVQEIMNLTGNSHCFAWFSTVYWKPVFECAFAPPMILFLSYLVKNSMDRVSMTCKLTMKWCLMHMCASWLSVANEWDIELNTRGEIPYLPTSSPGSSRFPIWRRQERRPWHTAEITLLICPRRVEIYSKWRPRQRVRGSGYEVLRLVNNKQNGGKGKLERS